MVGFTHAAVGVAAASFFAVAHGPAELAACAVGSVLPDVDHPGSTAGRLVPGSFAGREGRLFAAACLVGAGVWLKIPALAAAGGGVGALAFVRHRGVTHSLLGAAAAGGLCFVAAPGFLRPFLFGWLLHLASDALTPAGVPLFWPHRRRLAVGIVRSGALWDRLLGLSAAAYVLLGRR